MAEAGSNGPSRLRVAPLIAGVVTAGVISLAAAVAVALSNGGAPVGWRCLLAAAVVGAGWRLRFAVRVGGDRVAFFWNEAAMVLAAGLVAPAWVILLTAPAVAVVRGFMPGRQQPAKAAYNTATAILASSAAMATLVGVGATPLRLDSARDVAGLGVAAFVYVAVCDLLTSVVIAANTGRGFLEVQREGWQLQLVTLAGNLVAAAAVWVTVSTDPRLVVVAALAVFGTHQGYTGLRRVQYERRRRQELASAVAGLADAAAISATGKSVNAGTAVDGDELRVAETAVLRRAAELAADLFAADVVEIELSARDNPPLSARDNPPLSVSAGSGAARPWLYRRCGRVDAAEEVGFADEIGGLGFAADASAVLDDGAAVRGSLRLAFTAAVASIGLDEREQADLATFAAAVPAAVQVAREQAIQRRLRAEAEHRALHDSLTGLPNRRQLLEVAIPQREASLSVGEGLELTLVEVTGLAELARTVGHASGDRLLALAAERVRTVAVENGFAARLDGGRFALLAAFNKPAIETAAARRLRQLLAEPVNLPSGTVALTTVAATARAGRDDSAGELLRRAEVALAAARRAPERVASYDEALDVESTPQLMLGAALLDALRAGQIQILYQLARDLITGEPTSIEAMPSWTGAEGGTFSGDDLLELVSIDIPDLQISYVRWLLASVLDDRRAWTRQGVGVPVAVRLPRRCLIDPRLPSRMLAALRDAGIAADQIVVCVDDALATAMALDVTEVVGQLANAGIRIAVDRLSILEQLPTLPVDELRLPEELVSAVPGGGRAAALVAGAIATAAELGLRTTARGVHSEEHTVALRAMGCEAGQGEHVALTVDGVKAGRYLWATGLLSEALHPPANVVELADRRDRRRRKN